MKKAIKLNSIDLTDPSFCARFAEACSQNEFWARVNELYLAAVERERASRRAYRARAPEGDPSDEEAFEWDPSYDPSDR